MKNRITKLICISIGFVAITAICALSNSQVTYADTRSDQLQVELDEMSEAGVKGFLYWQYSGSADQIWAFGSDQYSFLKGDTICEVLKANTSKFDFLGVNIPSLGTVNGREAGAAEDALKYLSGECGINMIRIFGSPDRGGIDTTSAIADLAGSFGIKTIVVLCDYSNGCADLGIDNSRTNPTPWYQELFRTDLSGGPNYVGSYLNYAIDMAERLKGNSNVYAIELLNEPHCSGYSECVGPYAAWANEVAIEISSRGFGGRIGIGQKASENTTRGDSPGVGSPPDFRVSNSSGAISVASGHYYTETEKNTVLQALTEAKSLNKLFYIGEYGYAGFTELSGNRPLEKGFDLNTKVNCDNVREDEFHPLRPYPVSSCDLLIPQSKPEAPFLVQEMPSGSGNNVRVNKYINYACGTSIDFTGTESFDPHGYGPGSLQSPPGSVNSVATNTSYIETVCEPETYVCVPGQVCPELTCYRTLRYEIETDFRDSNLGFLGNTQKEYPDKELVNNYLSWYFTGTPQIGDQEPLEPYLPSDEHTIVNFTGPVRKLLPFDAQNSVRSVVASAHGQQDPQPEIVDVHNYIVGCQRDIDWQYFIEVSKSFFEVWFGNLFDLVRFMKLLWDAGESQADGYVKLGELLITISNRPELLEDENRLELIQLITDSGFGDLLEANFEFLSQLISLGLDNIRRLGTLIASVKTTVAESCKSSTDVKRLDYFQNKPYPDGQLPPDPNNPKYVDFDDFWKDYNKWRGATWYDPILFNFPQYITNTWAQLFPNIPLTGLEDIAGEEFFTGYGQGVGPYGGSDGRTTAPPQMNIIEAVPAEATQ